MTTPAAKTMVDDSTDTDMASARTNFPDAKTASDSLVRVQPTYSSGVKQDYLGPFLAMIVWKPFHRTL
jgi:hypothetical protein